MKDAPPSALEHVEEIQSRAKDKNIAVFFDYDGTLTRIVVDPEQAIMPDSVRERISMLSQRFPVGVISGRDLSDVRSLVGIPGVYYAGSHGFDIAGPQGTQIRYEAGVEYLSFLDMSEMELRERTGRIPGAWVERKRFSVAIHCRKVREEEERRVRRAVEEVAALHPELRLYGGKKIFELRPDIDWNKGKALLWILENLSPRKPDILPLYIGDDETDEDAFRVLEDRGVGIVIMDRIRSTAARYRLKDPGEVERFVDLLLESFTDGGS